MSTATGARAPLSFRIALGAGVLPATALALALTLALALGPGAARAETASLQVTTQVLEPVGGRILRPRNWVLQPAHRPEAYVWLVAPPTGAQAAVPRVRVETVLGARREGGADAFERAQAVLKAKSGEGSRVLRRCEPKDLGLFTRACLEVDEGAERVLYTVYWETTGRNIFSVVEARALQAQWPTYAALFARMANFQVLDMKQFEE